MSAICPDRPTVNKLEGIIKAISPRTDGGLSLTVIDGDGREFYVTTNTETAIIGCKPEPDRAICVEFGYLSTNRKGPRSQTLIEARVITVK